jgi:hypothetical protein
MILFVQIHIFLSPPYRGGLFILCLFFQGIHECLAV